MDQRRALVTFSTIDWEESAPAGAGFDALMNRWRSFSGGYWRTHKKHVLYVKGLAVPQGG